MPIVLGKLVFAITVTAVAASIAVALGTIMALVEAADEKAKRDRQAPA